MMTKFVFRVIQLCAALLVFSLPALAHPGNTDSYGGHYCWTNCTSWGYSYGSYHYHGSYDYSYSSYTTSIPSGPTKNYYDFSSLTTDGSCYLYAYTYDEIINFVNIYQEQLFRYPRCDELKFHVEHVTPHDILRGQLESSAEYGYAREVPLNGCVFHDNGGKPHAEMINNTYIEITGREANCNELTNHGLWQTSYDRLAAFLEPYRYNVFGYVYLDNKPLTGVKVSIFDNGAYIAYVILDSGYTSFDTTDFIKPYKIYRIKIEYKDKVLNQKIKAIPSKTNSFRFVFKSK